MQQSAGHKTGISKQEGKSRKQVNSTGKTVGRKQERRMEETGNSKIAGDTQHKASKKVSWRQQEEGGREQGTAMREQEVGNNKEVTGSKSVR